jgi:RHS repeat-associated protein
MHILLDKGSAQDLPSNRRLLRASVLCFAIALAYPSHVYAQVGGNNPTGVAGIFNGNVTTGCSYDPYTGNAVRAITDIAVAGAVGEYPLALVRTYNSRSSAGGAAGFGTAGQWTHNYSWAIEPSAPQNHPFTPSSYTVDYPDGRKVTFAYSASDPYYRGPLGVRERFQTPPQGGGFGYLILSDGGKVEFDCEELDSGPDGGEVWWWVFTATAIIDPYGIRTTFSYNGDGSLYRVTEQALRYLQFNYTSGTISSVTASDGRSVQYYYISSAYPPGTTVYTALDHVVYYGQSQWTAKYKYCTPNNAGNANGIPLLWTADDPMYSGPMHRIAYTYRTANNYAGSVAVYGQTSVERYWGGVAGQEGSGPAVTTLTVPNATTRTETRADGKTRTFTYTTAGYLTNCTDFMNHGASQGYDANKYINLVTDRNSHTTNYTRNALTGMVTQVKFPLTQGDTPGQVNQPTVNYTYGSASCADTNNRDSNNPYYVCTATDEGGHLTQFLRDVNKRITQINYPDGGYETFTYNGFGQVMTHGRVTGGIDTYIYDGRGLLQSYKDSTNTSSNPNVRYGYDALDRVTNITDVFGTSVGDANHSTTFSYNARAQVTVTTLPKDPVDNVRHSVTNTYNETGTNAGDGTLISVADQLGHVTSYTYDDYRRLITSTPPDRGDGKGLLTTQYFYSDPWLNRTNYADTNPQASFVTLPSGKVTSIVYDVNWRKWWTTVGWYSGDDAVTVYARDSVGNITNVTAPNQQPGQQYAGKSTQIAYDERNRTSSITDALNNITSFTYDTAGHRKSVTRPNGQTITNDAFDAMNRVTQQTATQTPEPSAVSKYTYYTSGLLNTMQDPRLVANNSTYKYTYGYDGMGRRTSLQYPPDSGNVQRTEQFTYDTAGRLGTFANRNGDTQTFSYDALNRMTGFTWDDGITPSVSFGYDVASRVTDINNANATITRQYWGDDTLHIETETVTGRAPETMTYLYDNDGNRSLAQWGGYVQNVYTYTGRNQLETLLLDGTLVASYAYDVNGNMITRTPNNTASSTYSYDALDRVTHITHAFNGTTRTFDYAYDSVGNRKWTKRDGGTGDVFRYDLADQTNAVKLNIVNPDTTPTPAPNIVYDANGNRTSFSPYGTTDTYTPNNLNQYATRNGINAGYDSNGNLATGFDSSLYTYDAQNRLISAPRMTFKYDGLNRQVRRTFTGLPGTTTYSVWDGWNLMGEYAGGTSPTAGYVYGAGELVKEVISGLFYFQDGSGSTSHLTDGGGVLFEWYRYDLQGNPFFYDSNNNQRNPNQSAYGVRHLFTGQQWYQQLGLYDLRNRFYSPDTGRFLQPDPISFLGDSANLYRYCRNNPVGRWDPYGLEEQNLKHDGWDVPTGGGDEFYTLEGMTESEYYEWGAEYNGPYGSEGPNTVLGIGPFTENPGGMGATVPGAAFFGANAGAGGMPSEAGNDPRGFGRSSLGHPGGVPRNSNSTASAVPAPMSQVIATMGRYRLQIDRNKVIVPVEHQFASYDLLPFADFWDAYALDVARVMAAPVAVPAGTYTAYYLGGALLFGQAQEVSDFAEELRGIPSDSYAPTTFGGLLGFGWRNAIGFLYDPGNWSPGE